MSAGAKPWMIYGAYGYTGELIVAEAKRRGLEPILAGRNRNRLEDLASRQDFDSRTFSLEGRFAGSLEGVAAVLHCAGPFSHTSRPMAEACLRRGASYLDITGEIEVFEAIMRCDAEARAAGISMIPGVGFDVIPTDCLAAKLKEQLPDATHLDLAFSTRGGGVSRGTLKTMIEGLGRGGAVRRDGKIERVPVAWDARQIQFDSGPRLSMTIPWGDVSTAYHTTGIPNIRVYASTSPRTVRFLRRIRPLLGISNFKPIRWMLLKLADRRDGPDDAQREKAHVELWGEVWNDKGIRQSMTMRVPEGYSLTATSSVLAIQRVLDGTIQPGASTPALAFGSGFIDEVISR